MFVAAVALNARSVVRDALVVSAHERLGATLEIADVRVGWGSAGLYGVRFHQDSHVGSLEVVADEVALELEMLPLLRGEAEVRSVAMRAPFIRLTLEREPNADDMRNRSGYVLHTVAVIEGQGELVLPTAKEPVVLPISELVYGGVDVQAGTLLGLFRTASLSATIGDTGHLSLMTSDFPRSFSASSVPTEVLDALFGLPNEPSSPRISLSAHDVNGDLNLSFDAGDSPEKHTAALDVIDDRDLRTVLDSVWGALTPLGQR